MSIKKKNKQKKEESKEIHKATNITVIVNISFNKQFLHHLALFSPLRLVENRVKKTLFMMEHIDVQEYAHIKAIENAAAHQLQTAS